MLHRFHCPIGVRKVRVKSKLIKKSAIFWVTYPEKPEKAFITSFPEYCSPGWNYFQGSCYYFSSTPKSWSDSKTDCLRKCASLVNIGSDAENEFINNQITNITWLGLKEVSGDRLNWINDGSEPFYAKWNNGQPVYQNGRDDCTFLQFEFWSTKDCSQNLPFVCEKG